VSSVQPRPYQPGDETALCALFARAFGRAITPEHWRWKLNSCPTPAPNVWLAWAEGRPIFQYAGIPTRFQTPHGVLTGMVSVDTMTDPVYRRQGLLSQVGAHAYATWRAAGIAFVIGLPNEQWGSRAAALGWRPLFLLQWWQAILNPARFLARKLRWPALAQLTALNALLRLSRPPRVNPAIHIRPLRQAGAECDALWEIVAPTVTIAAIRDRAWVQWRYFDAPNFNYQVLFAESAGQPRGYLAYRVEGPVGFLADVCATDADARAALLARALELLAAAQVDSLLTLALPGSDLAAALRRAGFLSRPHAFSVQWVPLAPDLPWAELSAAQPWHLTGGDFDVL